MRDTLTVRVRHLLSRVPYSRSIRQYLPYLVPGVPRFLEFTEPLLRHRLTPARSLEDIAQSSPANDMEHFIPCVLCGAERFRLVYRPGRRDDKGVLLWTYRVARCAECGLLCRMPAIRPERVPDLYAAYDYAEFLDSKYRKGRVGQYRRTLDAFSPFFASGEGRRLLDFGCGTGSFLDLATERGFDAFGVDLSHEAVEVARQRHGADRVHQGDPGEIDPSAAGGFDVITMFSVLAHFADPLERLQAIRRLLAPDGVLLLYTVNADSLELKAYTNAWPGFTRNHLVLWRPETLARLLRAAGFDGVVFRPMYGAAVENESDALRPRQRKRVIKHIDAYGSGAMMRALAVTGSLDRPGLEGAIPL